MHSLCRTICIRLLRIERSSRDWQIFLAVNWVEHIIVLCLG